MGISISINYSLNELLRFALLRSHAHNSLSGRCRRSVLRLEPHSCVSCQVLTPVTPGRAAEAPSLGAGWVSSPQGLTRAPHLLGHWI